MKIKWQGDLVDGLLRQSGDISCHSQFTHGVNLKVANHLLFLGDDQKGCVPFGIHLSSNDFQHLNQLVNWRGSIKRTTTGLLIDGVKLTFEAGSTYQNRLNCFDLGRLQSMATNTLVLGGYLKQTGLDFSPLMTELVFAKANQTRETSLDFITYYIGRGLGLTPAGDDFTIGLMAIESIHPFLPDDFRVILGKALADKRTTDVSKSYLVSASQGSFSSLVIDVIKGLLGRPEELAEAVLALADSGSTSGSDTLAGIYYGLQHIQDETVER
ncbi:DUF2877 domain-containing protein [uncultured Vagococcus sp.]|uniref:DUF2877 domain-containing protein n=1 Tax=uncultured Vagococcus sp. TaxID=189676 RepID=UPI0028D84EB0|nr:DUF2877 domain-containing protein [uncultured Vagococcus sp.]